MRTPSEELTRWLWLMTPPAAPTVPVLESAGRDDGPGHVPLLPLPHTTRFLEPSSPSMRLALVREAMPEGIQRKPGTRSPRAGSDRWRIEAAYRRDLHGMTEAEVGATLDLYDNDEESAGSSRCRRVRDYVVPGRALLAELGAWPWSLDDGGQLERRWWNVERYAAALLVWHEMSCMRAIEDAVRASRGLITSPIWRSLDETWRPAHDLYRAQLEAALHAADARAA